MRHALLLLLLVGLVCLSSQTVGAETSTREDRAALFDYLLAADTDYPTLLSRALEHLEIE